MYKKITIKDIQRMKNEEEKISMLTAYDFSTAKYIDESGIDMILVGDSVAMVILGYENTCAIGINEMKIFTKAVANGAKRSLIVADMPFLSCDADIASAVLNAGELIKNGANAVKIEGCSEHILSVVQRLVETGIPVMGHLGFTPQSLNQLGGYKVQGKTQEAAKTIIEQAKKLEKAGAFSIVLEMVPENCAKIVTKNLNIPTIGIGAGRYCSGQVLVSDDIFGKYSEMKPKFVRRYGDMKTFITDCAKKYNEDVKNGNFPNVEEIF